MYCEKLSATIAKKYCIERREAARNGNKAYSTSKASSELLRFCLGCKQGDKVENNPECFINRDHAGLIMDQLNKSKSERDKNHNNNKKPKRHKINKRIVRNKLKIINMRHKLNSLEEH